MIIHKEKTEEEKGIRINRLPIFEKENKRQVNAFIEALSVAFAKSLDKENVDDKNDG